MKRVWPQCVMAVLLSGPLAAQTTGSPAPPASPGWPTEAELAGSDPRLIIGVPSGHGLQGSELEAQTKDVSALLRCPVCQGLSVADSPSSTAQNMRRQVRELLERGYDRQQILAYFERSYGEFVRLQPPLRGINWLLWLAPAVALLGGGAFLVLRSRPRGAEEAATAAADAPPADPTLDAYRARARALALGDEPGGGESR